MHFFSSLKTDSMKTVKQQPSKDGNTSSVQETAQKQDDRTMDLSCERKRKERSLALGRKFQTKPIKALKHKWRRILNRSGGDFDFKKVIGTNVWGGTIRIVITPAEEDDDDTSVLTEVCKIDHRLLTVPSAKNRGRKSTISIPVSQTNLPLFPRLSRSKSCYSTQGSAVVGPSPSPTLSTLSSPSSPSHTSSPTASKLSLDSPSSSRSSSPVVPNFFEGSNPSNPETISTVPESDTGSLMDKKPVDSDQDQISSSPPPPRFNLSISIAPGCSITSNCHMPIMGAVYAISCPMTERIHLLHPFFSALCLILLTFILLRQQSWLKDVAFQRFKAFFKDLIFVFRYLFGSDHSSQASLSKDSKGSFIRVIFPALLFFATQGLLWFIEVRTGIDVGFDGVWWGGLVGLTVYDYDWKVRIKEIFQAEIEEK